MVSEVLQKIVSIDEEANQKRDSYQNRLKALDKAYSEKIKALDDEIKQERDSFNKKLEAKLAYELKEKKKELDSLQQERDQQTDKNFEEKEEELLGLILKEVMNVYGNR